MGIADSNHCVSVKLMCIRTFPSYHCLSLIQTRQKRPTPKAVGTAGRVLTLERETTPRPTASQQVAITTC
jgi:hypothetical protein